MTISLLDGTLPFFLNLASYGLYAFFSTFRQLLSLMLYVGSGPREGNEDEVHSALRSRFRSSRSHTTCLLEGTSKGRTYHNTVNIAFIQT